MPTASAAPAARPHQVGPPGVPVAEYQGRPERARGIHRGPADRRPPQPGQRDVAAHRDGGERPHLLGSGRGAEDHADEPGRQHQLPDHRDRHRDAGAGQGQARAAVPPDQRPQQQRGQHRAGELGHDVGGYPPPGEIATQRKRGAHHRVEVRAGDGPHEQDDRHHHQGRGDHPGRRGDGVPAEPRVHHPGARRHQDQEEGTEQLGEQPPPLVPVIPEVELPDDRVRPAEGPEPGPHAVPAHRDGPGEGLRPRAVRAPPRTVRTLRRRAVRAFRPRAVRALRRRAPGRLRLGGIATQRLLPSPPPGHRKTWLAQPTPACPSKITAAWPAVGRTDAIAKCHRGFGEALAYTVPANSK